MIPVICKCGGTEFSKAGYTISGVQRYRCRSCKVRSTRNKDTFEWKESEETDHTEYMFKKGVSKLVRDKDGNMKGWAKYDTDKEVFNKVLRDKFTEIFDGKPLATKLKKKLITEDEKCAIYPIGDLHLGSLCWEPETGKTYDLKEAAQRIQSGLGHLVTVTPSTDTAYILGLGDFFHTDNRSNKTESSGNVLDTDSRYAKMVYTGLQILHSLIETVRRNHKKVIVRLSTGNHDYHTMICINAGLQMYYSETEDVVVESNANPFYYFQFGYNMVCTTHGTLLKPQVIRNAMSADEPKMWGDTRYRVCYQGHTHHQALEEISGCNIESFTSIHQSDYWSHSMGYRASVRMDSIVLGYEGGEVERYRKNIKF